MYEVKENAHALIEVKQSKFFSFLIPSVLLEDRLASLKSEHPKARHFIVAWRKTNEFKQIQEYSTDDGEPKGTSGRPVLNVLRGMALINTAIIIVRYFGGTKLGTGGLVRAYTDAAKEVLADARIEAFAFKSSLRLEVPYTHNQKVEHMLKQENIMVGEQNYQGEVVLYKMEVTAEQLEMLQGIEQTERFFRLIGAEI